MIGPFSSPVHVPPVYGFLLCVCGRFIAYASVLLEVAQVVGCGVDSGPGENEADFFSVDAE